LNDAALIQKGVHPMWRPIRVAAVLLLFVASAFAQNVQRSEMSLNVHWYGAVP
jgi:hypothetical protein